MNSALDQVLQGALALPEADRQQLVIALVESLPPSAIEPDDDLVAELDRRCSEVDSGIAQSIPFDEVMARVGKKYPANG
jgi:putative addiction module component (TIGR02574 family)